MMRACSKCRRLFAAAAEVCPDDGAALVTVSLTDLPAALADKFAGCEPFARGGTGTLYSVAGEPARLLKVFDRAALGGDGVVAQLERELGRQAGVLEHGRDGAHVWLVRERASGESLAARLARVHVLPLWEALAIAAQVATQLEELHRAGLLQREVKPGHVLLEAGAVPIVRLIDTGVARRDVLDEHSAPEVRGGGAYSARSDLYGLGRLLSAMLAGDASQAPLDLAQPLAQLTAALLEADPHARPLSARQVRRALEPFLPRPMPDAERAARSGSSQPPSSRTGARTMSDKTQEITLEELEPAEPKDAPTQELDNADIEAAIAASAQRGDEGPVRSQSLPPSAAIRQRLGTRPTSSAPPPPPAAGQVPAKRPISSRPPPPPEEALAHRTPSSLPPKPASPSIPPLSAATKRPIVPSRKTTEMGMPAVKPSDLASTGAARSAPPKTPAAPSRPPAPKSIPAPPPRSARPFATKTVAGGMQAVSAPQPSAAASGAKASAGASAAATAAGRAGSSAAKAAAGAAASGAKVAEGERAGAAGAESSATKAAAADAGRAGASAKAAEGERAGAAGAASAGAKAEEVERAGSATLTGAASAGAKAEEVERAGSATLTGAAASDAKAGEAERAGSAAVAGAASSDAKAADAAAAGTADAGRSASSGATAAENERAGSIDASAAAEAGAAPPVTAQAERAGASATAVESDAAPATASDRSAAEGGSLADSSGPADASAEPLQPSAAETSPGTVAAARKAGASAADAAARARRGTVAGPAVAPAVESGEASPPIAASVIAPPEVPPSSGPRTFDVESLFDDKLEPERSAHAASADATNPGLPLRRKRAEAYRLPLPSFARSWPMLAAAGLLALTVVGLSARACNSPDTQLASSKRATPATPPPTAAAVQPDPPAAAAEPPSATAEPAAPAESAKAAADESEAKPGDQALAVNETPAESRTLTAAQARPLPLGSRGGVVPYHGSEDADVDFKARGRAYFSTGKYREAADAYQRASQRTPSDAGAFAGLGASWLAAGQADRAISAYQRALQLKPDVSGFQAALGRAYLQKGDRGRAAAAYRKALSLDPQNPAARSGLQSIE